MDVRKKLESDIAFVNGLLSEEWLAPVFERVLIEAKQQMEKELAHPESQDKAA